MDLPKLYKFQQKIVDSLISGEKIHFNIPTGCGKAYILCKYAQEIFPKELIIFVNSSLMLNYYISIIEKYEIKNIKLINL